MPGQKAAQPRPLTIQLFVIGASLPDLCCSQRGSFEGRGWQPAARRHDFNLAWWRSVSGD